MFVFPFRMNRVMLWAWIAMLAVALMPARVRAQDDAAKLGPFPAQAMAWTDADKEAQRQAGAKLSADLQAAVAAGAKTFVIPRGDYRFAKATHPSANPTGNDPASGHTRELSMLFGTPQPAAYIYLDGVKDMTIDGSGSTLVFEDTDTALAFNQCVNVTLKNLAIDYDPLPFVQGKIVATHFDSDEVDVEMEPAYLNPRSIAMIPNVKPTLRFEVFDPATRQVKANQGNAATEEFWQRQIAPNTYRIKLAVYHGTPVRDLNLAVGDLVVLWRRELEHGRVLRLESCAGMVLENVSIYAAAMTAFMERNTLTQTTYRHDQIIRRPGTDRLLACNGGGIMVTTCQSGPLVEQCTVEFVGDDVMNVHSWFRQPLVQESPTVVVVEALPHLNFCPGAAVQVFDSSHGVHLLGTRQVVACEPTTWTPVKGQPMLMQANPELHWSMRRSFLVYDAPMDAQRLTLDQPIELPANSLFAYPGFNNAGTVVRDCDFSNTNTRAVLIRSPGVQMIGNRFRNIGGEAIGVDGELGANAFGEGTFPADVLIQGNQFTNCGTFVGARMPMSAVFVNTPQQLHLADMPDTTDCWVSHVRIVDNTFTDCPREAIRVLCAKDLTITGNTITGYNQAPSFVEGPTSNGPDRGRYLGADHGIVLDHVLGLTLENNTLSQPGPVSQGEYFRLEVTPAP